jgi:hypothetical protein
MGMDQEPGSRPWQSRLLSSGTSVLDNDDESGRYHWHGTHVAGSCFGTDSKDDTNHGDSNNIHADDFSDIEPYQEATAHFSLGIDAGARATRDGLVNNNNIVIDTSPSEQKACSPESCVCVENIAAEKRFPTRHKSRQSRFVHSRTFA